VKLCCPLPEPLPPGEGSRSVESGWKFLRKDPSVGRQAMDDALGRAAKRNAVQLLHIPAEHGLSQVVVRLEKIFERP
jgi:hypothetical protein